MPLKYKIIIAGVALLSAFSVGRYLTPQKIVTVTVTKEVEKKTEQTDTQVDQNKHRVTQTTTTKKPDGSEIVVSVVTEDINTAKQVDQTKTDYKTITQTETKTVTNDIKRINLALLAGVNVSSSLTNAPLVYGGYISTQFIGPATIGVWGLDNKTGGIALGLNF